MARQKDTSRIQAFSKWLRAIAPLKGFESQRQLAIASKVNEATISRIWNEAQLPDELTVAKLAKTLGVEMLDALKKAGYTVSTDFTTASSPLPLPKVTPQGKTIMVPIIGSVKAGPNGISFQEPLGTHEVVESALIVGVQSYWLQVRGDSMSPYLLPGDLVLFHECPDVPSGSLAIIIIDGEEGTVKWLKRDDNYIRLEAENPYYPPREFRDKELLNVKIVGPVTEISRKPARRNGGIIRP